MKPIKIIGGGIAGLSLGIALRRQGVPVTVREAGHYPRHRVCGEFLCGVSDATLDRLGVADALHGSVRNRTTGWYRGNERIFRRDLETPARGLSRLRLDCRLADRLEGAGGTLSPGDRATSSELAGDPEGTVCAWGKNSGQSDWIGLKIHLSDSTGLTEDLQMHIGERGYAGVSRIEEDRVNLCGLFRRRPALKGQGAELIGSYLKASGMTALAERVGSGSAIPSSFAAVSGFTFSRPAKPVARTLRLGDADGMIPPFTGNGMSLALESTECVLPHLVAYARGERSWIETVRIGNRETGRRFRSRRRAAVLLNALLIRNWTQNALTTLVARNLVPFSALYRLTH